MRSKVRAAVLAINSSEVCGNGFIARGPGLADIAVIEA